MMSLKVILAAASLAVGFLYFYASVPDGMSTEDQWLMRKLYAFNKAINLVVRLAALVGYDSHINMTRMAFNSHLLQFHPDDNFEVTSTNHQFTGVDVIIHQKPSWSSDDGQTEKLRPAIFYIHGGGWVYDFKKLYSLFARYLCHILDVTIVTVDYRLAPEHPYPAGLNDCLVAIKHFHEEAKSYGVDPEKISVAGDSAGGNLAAAVALKLRDEGSNFLLAQILISPVLQFASFRLESFLQNEGYGSFVRQHVIQVWLLYINESLQYASEMESEGHISGNIINGKVWPFLAKFQKSAQDRIKSDQKSTLPLENRLLDPYLCPLFAKSLDKLPPTLLLVSDFDLLRDEALAFGDRLKAEGNDVTVYSTPAFHGVYTFFDDSQVGRDMVGSIATFFKEQSATKAALKSQTLPN